MFNGIVFSCNQFVDDGQRLFFNLNSVDYATYKWARDNKHPIPGTYAMGNGMLLFDPKRKAYVLLQRSNGVAFDKGKISGIGGVLDFQEGVNMAGFLGYVRQQTLKEVDEEVCLQESLSAVALLGLYVDTDTLKVEFLYRGTGVVLGVKAAENKRIVEVSQAGLMGFVRQNQTELEESTRIHLNNLTSKLAK